MYNTVHDARLHFASTLLGRVGYELCRTDVSPGFLGSCIGNLKPRRRNLRCAPIQVSANFLTANCIQKLSESELAIVSATKEYKSVKDRVVETNSGAVREKSSENPREVIPTTTKYIAATGKKVLTLLQSAATFIPVPLIQETIGVALKIIEVCEVRKIGCEMGFHNILIIDRIYLPSIKKAKSCKIGYAI